MKALSIRWAVHASVQLGNLAGVFMFLCALCAIAEEVLREDQFPPGHLLPLGFHQEPEPPFDEKDALLSPQDFFEKFSRPGKPVVFRKIFSDSPALKKWQDDDYLR